MSEPADRAARRIHERASLAYEVGIVLGSGLGGVAAAVTDAVRIPYAQLPGFPVSSVSSHGSEVVAGRLEGVPVIVLSGRAHYYESGDAGVMRTPIETLRAVGCDTLLLTNSAGSLRNEVGPGEIMLISDHIAFSGRNPLIGEPTDARFVGLTEAYDASLRTALLAAAEEAGVKLATGVYMWFSGPSFETPAEIRMARILGADAVGMSTVPEAIVARHMGMEVLGISCITNMAAGVLPRPLDHAEVMATAHRVRGQFIGLLEGVIEQL